MTPEGINKDSNLVLVEESRRIRRSCLTSILDLMSSVTFQLMLTVPIQKEYPIFLRDAPSP